jgi:surface carbohydrate biosynthesis protein
MKKTVDILLFVEHVARELDIACVLKHILARDYGIALEIASYVYDRDAAVQKWDPFVVAISVSFMGMQSPFLSEVIRGFPDAVFVDLEYEQLYHQFNRDFRRPQDDFARLHVLHNAWGDFHARFLQENQVPTEHIAVCGNPTYALYGAPYKDYFPSRQALAEQYGLDITRRWVLIPENYKAAFLPDSYFESFVKMGSKKEEAFAYRDFDVRSMEIVVPWWYRVAREADVEVIVRPRPANESTCFLNRMMEIGGEPPAHLHLIKDGTVREWIMASDVTASSISTTLLEACVADKGVYIFAPIPIPAFLHNEWYDLITAIQTYEQFARIAQSGAVVPEQKQLKAWIARTMMGRGDAIANIAALLGAVLKRERRVPSPPRRFIESVSPLPAAGGAAVVVPLLKRSLFKNAWHKIKRKLMRAPAKDKVAARPAPQFNPFEQDRFSRQDVQERVQRWQQVLKTS